VWDRNKKFHKEAGPTGIYGKKRGESPLADTGAINPRHTYLEVAVIICLELGSICNWMFSACSA